jgi:cytochrome oxidase assembly protein ShyY1
VLREPYWVRAALLVVLLSIACVLLGRWQWGRHEGKVAIADRIAANYDAPPADLGTLLPSPTAPFPAGLEWRPVRLHGSYLTDRTVLVRNRPLDVQYGYEVLVPFRPDSGPLLLVDRGWIPAGASGAQPDSVPTPPTGEVTVVARLRPTEPPLARTPPPGQALRIDVPRITSALPAPAVTGAYGLLASESPAPATAPTLLPRPDADLGPHLAYAIQWWVGAVVLYVLLVVYASKEAGRRQTVGETGNVAPGGPELTRRLPGGFGAGRSRRRDELTDEEWEDLADAAAQAGGGHGVVGRRAPVDDDHASAGPQRDVDE